ncbi:hypothetical protein L204_100762 [Cryptococcus depauperatus]|nr:SCY1 protein kinase [Cryptococcus depauperatus CBS 7855]
MFAAASNLFNKSSYLSAYTVHSTPSPSPSSSSTNLPSLSASLAIGSSSSSSGSDRAFNVGLWKILSATHKTTGKEVSVWIFEKKVLDGVKPSVQFGGVSGRDWVLQQLKKEASSLSRLRHPDILHMVEPLEDSRSELTFITERITSSLSSLATAVTSSTNYRGGRPPTGNDRGGEIDLDEVEIQKGTLQIARGLSFLHDQAKLVHLNLDLDAIVINAKGDWKLTGLSHTTPLSQPDGSATRYVYPEVNARLPPQVQWKLDYIAPEYALDSSLNPSNDLYSIGCVLYAVHMGGKPPFMNRGSMQSLRENAEGKLMTREWASGSRWERCSSELKDLLPRLLTRLPSTRISLASLSSHPFFSSLAISTLNFLDPTTFASKPREEKATFLRGLVRVVPTFSERLRKGKVLPSLLEEMKDTYLLPFILPNVFEISKGLSQDEFAKVLIKLRPLFVMKDPPQNMLTLLEHLSLFEEKTTPQVFRESVMPLIYSALESEHQPVQERALKTVAHLCKALDYSTVQDVLLVKVAIVFTRTRILSVKVQTLQCFKAMVTTLDKATLTGKLVPLLAKIKTKEPAVMMATLAVHEAMGAKVDREAIATLVLPQLWSMSMGPLLNAEQFSSFMTVIKTLGARVEQEHSQHLRDAHRIEQQTASLAIANNEALNGNLTNVEGGEVDFESLVRGTARTMPDFEITSVAAGQDNITAGGMPDPWEDEGWLDGSTDGGLSITFPSLSINNADTSPLSMSSSLSLESHHANDRATRPTTSTSPSTIKAKIVTPSAFDSSVFTSMTPIPQFAASNFTPLRPQTHSTSSETYPVLNKPGPNYNISLPPQVPIQPHSTPLSFMSSSTQHSQSSQHPQPPSLLSSQALQPKHQPLKPSQSFAPPPLGWSSGVMQPTSAPKAIWGKQPAGSNGGLDWGDLDPLK